MSNHSNVFEQELINLQKLAAQQQNQRAPKINNRILKQTLEVKLAESLSPMPERLDEIIKSTQEILSPITKKLDTINESIKESNSENNEEIKNTPRILLQNTLKYLAEAPNSLKLNKDKKGNLSILGVPL